MMTIRVRQPSCPANSSSNSTSSFPFFGAFSRSFGFGASAPDQQMLAKEANSIPNCVYANWPEIGVQRNGDKIGGHEEKSRVFIILKNDVANKQPVHLQLKQDPNVERRILSMPAHILRWAGLESGDEVSIQLNIDLGRGFLEGSANLAPISFAISRAQIQVQLTELRDMPKLSLRADSLADYFRQQFLHDVLNVGQCCLLEFECATSSSRAAQIGGDRKRKYVEMEAEKGSIENDLKPPQHKKGSAASILSTFLGWTPGIESGTQQQIERKYTIQAKILALHWAQPAAASSPLADSKAQYGLVKEATQIVLCPVAESGLFLYGDPSIIGSNLVHANTSNNAKTTGEKIEDIIENGTKQTEMGAKSSGTTEAKGTKETTTNPAKAIEDKDGDNAKTTTQEDKLKEREVEEMLNQEQEKLREEHELLMQEQKRLLKQQEQLLKQLEKQQQTLSLNLNNNLEGGVGNNDGNGGKQIGNGIRRSIKLIVEAYSESVIMRSNSNSAFLVHQQDYNVVTKIFAEEQQPSSLGTTSSVSPSLTNLHNQRSIIIINYKIVEDSGVNNSNEQPNITEKKFAWPAINQTEYSSKGVRGKIYMTQEIMDQFKLVNGHEVTIESYNATEHGTTAKQITIEINQCDGSINCPLIKQGLRNHPTNSTFFHANDIINSLRKALLNKIVNTPTIGYVIVYDEEIRNRMKKFKSNLFDGETNGTNSNSCLKYQLKEIQATSKASISSNSAGTNDEKSATSRSSENATNQNAAENNSNEKQENVAAAQFAIVTKDTAIKIKCINSNLTIFGLKGQSKAPSPKLFDQNGWDLHKKIGGLGDQLGEIFRRAFASRTISAECSKQMGIKHLRGIVLHGPPGTGKTLIARELAKALNSREPKIINGAEIQSMWFGQSEKNVRSLFVDAEREQALAGEQSRLHVIIIDELDALCSNRQNMVSTHRTEQRIVNTLLAKLDGVELLDNILLIGMTNLLETIDPALLRPGRLELKIHIGLPDEKGRREILDIHTNTMRETKRLHEDVDLDNLARKTVNYSGAELEGLVRAAQSQAIQRIVRSREKNATTTDESSSTEENPMTPPNDSDESEMRICASDFEMAFENDIEPAFGKGSMDGAQLKAILCREPILWCSKIEQLLEKGKNLVDELLKSNTSTIGHSQLMLLNGPRQSGKTFLATTIAQRAGIPYIRLVTADSILNSLNGCGKSPTSLFDKILSECENTEFACIIFDELEHIIGYNEANQNWHPTILQKLAIILDREPSKGKRLLLLATSCEQPEWFEKMNLHSCLQNRMELPTIGRCEDVVKLLGAATTKKEQQKAQIGTTENGEEMAATNKLFTKEELDSLAKAISPELMCGGSGAAVAKRMPTIKDLVKLIDWHSQQYLEGKSGAADSSSAEGQQQQQEENKNNLFEQFKQRLLQIIAQKGSNDDRSGTAHLSMYR